MKHVICLALALCITAAIPTGVSQQGASSPFVSMMIDISGSLHPTENQSTAERDNIKNMYNALTKERIPSTMFLTQDVSASQLALYLTQLGLYGDIEFGISGNSSDEKLSTMPYSKQLAILEGSKKYASAAHVCGKNEKPITGFKPQSFDQNEDTYRALDTMGIRYDAGFQAGILYAPGHEKDVWPYPVEGHKFYAVPLSVYFSSGENMPLQDSYFQEHGLDASQWYNALAAKFNETRGNREPLVFGLTTSVSGSGDYLAALKKFISYAKSENATFANATALVDMAQSGSYASGEAPVKAPSTGCSTCDQKKSSETSNTTLTIFVSMNNTTNSK